MIKKIAWGLGVALVLVLGTTLPAFADYDGTPFDPVPTDAGSEVQEDIHVTGPVQGVDEATGTFTVLASDGTLVTVVAPDGFDLTSLTVGVTVKAEGALAEDGSLAADEIELEDADEDGVEDEDVDDDENEFDEDDLDEDEDDDEDDEEDEDSHQSGDNSGHGGGHDDDDGEEEND